MTTETKADAQALEPCPGDNTLSAAIGGKKRIDNELLGHLARCAMCQELVAELLRGTGAEDPRYRIEGLVGTGGMGLVLRAHDAVLDRTVALKLLWATPTGSVEPALVEARMQARFSHPNIVAVHDAGLLPHLGVPFIAMEFIAGETLRGWLGKPHPWREVLAVFLDAAAGLHAAHARGIVHADFKPANVLLPSDGGRARVTDFGLSRPVADPVVDDAFAGTPRYLAPEQRLAGGTALSDQYAFGLALHEALWGQHPGLPDSCPARGCQGVPHRLRAVVARCIRSDPDARYASMADVAAKLRATTRTRPGPWLVGITGLIVAAPSVGHWLWPPDACLERAESRRVKWESLTRPRLADGLTAEQWRRGSGSVDMWVARWAERAELSCSGEESPAVLSCLEERWATLEALTTKLYDDDLRGAAAVALLQLPSVESCREPSGGEVPPDIAAGRIATCASAVADGRALLLLGDPLAAKASLIEASSMAEAHGLTGLQARAQLLLAKSLWQASELDEAFETFSTASTLAVRAGLPDLGAVAMGASAQYVAHVRRDPVLARHWLDQARAVASRGNDPATSVNLDRFEAWVLSTEGRHRDAADLMRTVIERIDLRAGDQALAQSTNYEDLANFLARAGEEEMALAEIERSLTLRRQVVGESHVMLAAAMRSQTAILQRSDRFGEAAAILADLKKIWAEAYGPNSASVAMGALFRADILMDAERYAEAAVDLELATKVFGGPDSPDLAKAVLCEQLQARLSTGLGEPERARTILRGLLEGAVNRPALSAQRVALIHRELGRAELDLGNYAEAERWLRKALATEHELDGTTLGELHFALAHALRGDAECGPASMGAAREAITAWRTKATGHALERAAVADGFLDSCAQP